VHYILQQKDTLFCKIWDQEKQSPGWLINGQDSLKKTSCGWYPARNSFKIRYSNIYIYIIGSNAGVVRSVTFDSCIEKILPDSPLTSVRTDGNSMAASIYWQFLLLEASRGFTRFLRVTIKTVPSNKFPLMCKPTRSVQSDNVFMTAGLGVGGILRAGVKTAATLPSTRPYFSPNTRRWSILIQSRSIINYVTETRSGLYEPLRWDSPQLFAKLRWPPYRH
jgi:hypothetical protein